jgi:hypothetical protein
LHLFSDNEAAIPVASLIFLMTDVFGVRPVPGYPGKVAALSDPDASIDEEDVPVAHRAEVEERMPGH